MILVSNELGDSARSFGISPQIVAPVSMSLQPFALAFPQLATATSDQLLTYLQMTDQFQMTALANKDCGSFWIGENELGFIGVARWGTSQGLVVTTQKTASNIGHDGILALFSSLKITACSQ